MSASPPSAETGGSGSRRGRKRRNQTPNGDEERQTQKQKAPRTTLACERCRLKKLRCMGGHPCSACQRAKTECDFGDRGEGISITNQRLDQLEKTLAELVAILNARPPAPAPASALPPADDDTIPISAPSEAYHQLIPGLSATATRFQYQGSVIGSINGVPCLGSPPLTERQTTAAPRSGLSFTAPASISPLPQSPGIPTVITPRPPATSSLPDDPRTSERLESRWAALQRNSAPFPALMAHPTAWSEESARTSPDGRSGNAHPTLGMTHYKAQVHLQSEPISEGIVGEVAARALFNLFFQKCHPSFPLLDSYRNLKSHFDHIRSSAPFLFTTILAIAARYYAGYHKTQSAILNLPPVTNCALESLADLACAHLGFVLLRKQHQLSDVQATLLLSVWIPRGKGQSADQWMVSGLCTRLAYRIGIPHSCNHPVIQRIVNSTALDLDDDHDVREIEGILDHWHTWLVINQYDLSLSLGFGRPYPMPFTEGSPRQYLAVRRKIASLSQFDTAAATYVTALVELSTITSDLITGLRNGHLQPTHHNSQPTDTAWAEVSNLLTNLNPRLDEWQRRWTWGGSYDAIALGGYTKLVTIYGHHARLCLNSLSLNYVTSNMSGENQQNLDPMPYLARSCEAVVSLVQAYVEPNGTEPIIRYGADYLVLILGQAAVFIIRILATRLEQSLPIDQLVLLHYLKTAIEMLEANNLSTTNISGWVAQLSRDLAHYAGITPENGNSSTNGSSTAPDLNSPETAWDFDFATFISQNVPVGETGLDTGGYFDFAQTFYPTAPGGLSS